MSHYIHNTPSRLRLQIPTLKRDIHRINEIKLLLRGRQGVESVEISDVTGSVKINFDRYETDANQLLGLLAQEGYVDMNKLVPSHQYMDRMFSKVGETASKALFNFAVDKAFEGSSLSMIAAFI